MAVRRALSVSLALGLALPLLGAAVPASADPLVSGITVDTGYSDGLFLSAPSALLSPTYEATATVAGAVTTFRTRAVSSGTYSGPQVSVAPPTGTATLAVGHYATTGTATDVLAGLVVTGTQVCSTGSEGTLDVADVSYATGAISSLAASWSYHCTGTAAWAFGEVRFASTAGVTSASETRFLSLGSTGTGTTTPAKSAVLKNTGTLPITLGSAHFTGTDPGDFAVGTDTCSGQPLAVGATCTVSVTSTPTAGGNRAAVLEVPDGSARGFRHTDVFSGGLTAPGVPTAVSAAPATDGVAVTWGSPASNGGSPVTGFQVFRGTSPDDLVLLGTTSGLRFGDPLSGTTAADTTYLYAVKAVNAIGSSAPSATSSATTPAAAAVPANTGLLSLDVAAGYAGIEPKTLSRSLAAGDIVSAWTTTTADGGLVMNGNRPDGVTVGASLHFPTGAAVQAGTFPLGAVQDASHGTLSLSGIGGYCPLGTSGTASITRLERTSNGDLVFFDADLSVPCGGGAGLHRLSARFGTTTPYTEVQVADVTAGPVAVGSTKTVQSSYQNTGSTPVTISAVTVTAPDGGAAVDWSASPGQPCVGALLAPGSSCETDLQVAPTATGARPAQVVYTDSTPLGSHTRHLTATGVVTPDAPAGFAVSRSGGKVTLTWSSYAASGHEPTSWDVSVGPDADHLTPLATVTSPTVTDPSTADGYRVYRVTATNLAGTGAPTDVPVNAGIDAPVASGFVTVKNLVLTWQQGTSKLPSDSITGYRVYRGATVAALAPVGDVTGNRYVGTAPAAGAHDLVAVAPLVGTTLGPRSNVVDLVGTTTQLVVAAVGEFTSSVDVRGTAGGTGSSITPSADDKLRIEVSVSPKGTQVAYLELAFGVSGITGDIWIRNVDGSGTPRRLTTTGTPKGGIAWSPDGTRIAFSDYSGDAPVLKVLPSAGGALTTVPASSDLSAPTWLDGATLIAEDDSSFTAPLVKVVVASGARTTLAGTGSAISPSARPDGTEVAFLTPYGLDDYNQLKVLNLKTGAVRLVSAPSSTYLTRPAWTRDGGKLFTTTDEGDVVGTASNGTGTFSQVGTGDAYSVAVSTPDVTGPTGVRLANIPASTVGATVTPTFAATDALNGIGSYTVLYRRAAFNSGYSALTGVTTTSPRAIAVARGYSYCFSVRATDRAGNVSATTPEQCTVVPLDDRSLTRSSKLAAVTGSQYYAATAARTTTKGQTLTRTGVTSAKQLFLVATTCRGCGTVDVLVGSARIASINLNSATTVNRRVFALPSFSVRNGTVTIRVTSTAKTVVIDGLGIRK